MQYLGLLKQYWGKTKKKSQWNKSPQPASSYWEIAWAEIKRCRKQCVISCNPPHASFSDSKLSKCSSGVLPQLICPAISALAPLDSVHEHTAVYNDSGYNSCQLLLTAREFALANLPCTKPAAPLPSSSTWAMLNRIPIEKWGPDSSPRPPFLLQAMNPSFHGHSAILWSPRGLMDAKVWEGLYEERQTWSPRTRNNMRAPSIATDSGSAAYWPEHASWLAKTVQTHDGCFSQISAKG